MVNDMPAPIVIAQQAWESATEPYPLNRATRRGSVEEPFRRFGDSIAWLEWCEWCTIKKIETLKSRTGASTRLIVFLKTIADREKIRITGNPLAYEPTSPLAKTAPIFQEQLERWYSNRGFLVQTDSYGCPHLWYPNPP